MGRGNLSDFLAELKLHLNNKKKYFKQKFCKIPTVENATEFTLIQEVIHIVDRVAEKYTDEDQPVDVIVRTDGDWVLCSDRLPDKTGGYLVTYIYPSHHNNYRYCAYSHWRADGRWDEEILHPHEKVIAWKEVKPYEEPLLRPGDR